MKNHIEIEKKNKRIKIYGNQATIDRAVSYIENLDLTGIEEKDRLIIQKCIDTNKIGATNLSDDLYKFFTNACGDIAHYDIVGYAHYYDNSFRKFEEDFLQHCDCNKRFSDVERIFEKLKIGKFYKERNKIDLNKLSKKDLKNIIEQCGWEVVILDKNIWQLSLNINSELRFRFELDASSQKQADIIFGLISYCIKFDADEYIEMLVKERENNNYPSIRTIVNNTNIIQSKMREFATDLLYYGRIAAQNLIEKEQEEVEIEMER